jgi:hypothetical protein
MSADVPTAPTGATPTARPKRRWPALLAGALLLAAVMPAVWLYRNWANERALAEVVAELDRTDPGWRFADILAARDVVPDEQNSALQMLKIFSALGRRHFSLPTEEAKLFEEPPPAAILNSQQEEILRDQLGKAQTALREARKLRDMDRGRHPIAWTNPAMTLVPTLQQTRDACELLRLDTLLRLHDGDDGAALDGCRCMLAVARSVGDEPCGYAMIIRIADTWMAIESLEQTLAQAEPPPEQLAEFQTRLERELDQPDLRACLRASRALDYETIQAMREGRVKYSDFNWSGKTSNDWFRKIVYDRIPGAVPIDFAEHLRLATRMVAVAAEPEERRDELAAAISDEATRREAVPEKLVKEYTRLIKAHTRGQANLRCAIVALAAERYRRRHHGWPETLDQLAKDGLLKAVPRDPFDGQPLRWRRLEQGPVVYSVGPDRKDDGGAAMVYQPNQPDQTPRGDFRFLLFDPPHRRQPPVPVQPLVKE